MRDHVDLATVRRQAREWLGELDVPEGATNDVLIVISELVSNGIVAGRAAGRVAVLVEARWDSGSLHVRVRNTGGEFPRDPMPLMPAPADAQGRGLAIVAALSGAVEVVQLVGGVEIVVTHDTQPRPGPAIGPATGR